MTTPFREKRRRQRVPCQLWIEAERQDELYFQRTADLSGSGAFFTQTFPLPVGSEVRLRFCLPGDAQEIECRGAVANTRELGMGVHFLDLSARDRSRVEALTCGAR